MLSSWAVTCSASVLLISLCSSAGKIWHEPRRKHQQRWGWLSLVLTVQCLFSIKEGGYVGNLVHSAKDKSISLSMRMSKDVCAGACVCVCVILAGRPSPPHSFPLIPSACQAVSQGLCAPQIRRRPFVVRWWRFVSEEGIWLCII